MSRKFHYAWVILIAAWLAFGGVGLIRFVYPYVVPTMEKTLGLSHAMMAVVISCFFWVDFVMRVVWGTFSDRFGTRRTTLLGLFVLAVGFFVMSLAKSATLLAVGFAVGALGASALFIFPAPLLSHWFGQRTRATALGICTTSATVVMIIAGFLVPPFLAKHSYNVIWQAEAVFTLVILVVCTFTLANFPSDKGLNPYGAGQDETIKTQPRSTTWGGQSILRVVTDWTFGKIAISYFMYGIAFTGVLTFVVDYFIKIGWHPAVAGRLVSLFGFAALIGAIFWGVVGDHLAKRHVFGIGMAMQGVGFLILLLGGQVAIGGIIGMILFGFGGASPVVMISAIQADYFERNIIGTSFGLCAACFSLASAVGPIIGGALSDYSGTLRSALWVGVAAAVIGTIIVLMVGRPRIGASPQTTK